jgi:PAS domain S-box-containing protein
MKGRPIKDKIMENELHVLHVEDNDDDYLLIMRALKKSGFTTVPQRVDTKEAFVAALDTQHWDVVLSDYAMPHFNGMDALKTILDHECDPPFIIVSGAVGEERAVALLKAGAYDYIRKDNLARLGQSVRRALDQKETYKKQTLAEKALKESEERYRLVFEHSPLGIAQFDEMGGIVDCNENFAQIFGSPKAKLVGVNMLQSIPDGPIHDALSDALTKGYGQFEGNYKTITDDKDIRAIHSAITDKDGTIIGAVGIFEDISKQVRLESHIKQIQKMESIGNLAGGIAHDFNNLLFPIMGLSEMLLEDLPKESNAHMFVTEILKAGKRGSELVKQVLAFSRKSDSKKIPVQFQKIIKEALKLSRSAIPTSVEISSDIFQDCGMVEANPTQLHQIVMNLVTNAYHALEEASGTIDVQLQEVAMNQDDIEIKTITPGAYARLTISDTGTGIKPEIREKIFEPYFTTKEKGKGTGLGLSMVYGIIKDHKGDIQVYSELGKGSVFSVYIPLLKEIIAKQPTQENETISTGNEKILLVDDEQSIVQMEKKMLERMGYSVTAMTDSVQAVEMFKKNPQQFDLIITDMTMPKMTGDQLARELIAIRPEIPVIISTGYSDRLNEKQAGQLGIKAFLMKPVSKFDMARTVREVLDSIHLNKNGGFNEKD